MTREGREPWYSKWSWENTGWGGAGGGGGGGGTAPAPAPVPESGEFDGAYDEVALRVRKLYRHSSQNGAIASRGVRHCGHSSAWAVGSPALGG